MSRQSTLFVTGLITVALFGALAPPATAGHYGVDVWIMEPTTIHNADPAAGLPNAFLNDGKGDYWETPDNFSHLHDYAYGQSYEDYFLIRDQKGTKRYMRLRIPGVTNGAPGATADGTVTCWKDVHFYVYPWADPHWFNHLAVGATEAGYGGFDCYIDGTVSFTVLYPEETWCLTITRLPDTASGKKKFRFSAPEGCAANVRKTTKVGRDQWAYETWNAVSVPFDVDSVASSTIKTA